MPEWLKYIGGGLALLISSGLIQFFITRHDNKSDKQSEIIKANSSLLVGLAQDRLVFLTDKYLKRGVITLDELAILEEIYKPYHDQLGGNGRGKAGIELCRQLPIVSEEIAIMKDKEG